MKSIWGMILFLAVIFSSVSCKEIRSSLSDLTNSTEGGPEALPDSESLAGADGLPVIKSFQTVGPSSIASFTGAGDRISVVEFYSDT